MANTNNSVFILPCEPVWEDTIYQIEVTDPVLGYNQATNVDGPANRQALQLGNRTEYLKELIEVGHTNGRHSLTDADFAPGTKIPESALALDHGTKELQDSLTQIDTTAQHTQKRAESLLEVNLSFSGAMLKLIPFSQEYSGSGLTFELFTESVSARDFSQTTILREIAGDDSLDVESTEGLQVGKEYLLMDADGRNVEEVVVRSVLTENRVRFHQELKHTRNTGLLTATNLIPKGSEGATANGDFTYISKVIECPEEATHSLVIVHRDAGKEVAASASYRLQDSTAWHPAVPENTIEYVDGTVDDVFTVPAGDLAVRLDYTAGEYPLDIHHIVFKPIKPQIWIEDIRLPEIVTASLVGSTLTVIGSTYASLYDIPQYAAEIKISTEQHFAGETVIQEVIAQTNTVTAELPEDFVADSSLYVRLRYTDSEGTKSRWSDAYTIVP